MPLTQRTFKLISLNTIYWIYLRFILTLTLNQHGMGIANILNLFSTATQSQICKMMWREKWTTSRIYSLGIAYPITPDGKTQCIILPTSYNRLVEGSNPSSPTNF